VECIVDKDMERRNMNEELRSAIRANDNAKAIEIIATGKVCPEQADDNRTTILMLACVFSLSDVALALIATGESHPEQVDNDGNTALMFACKTGLSEVAMTLVIQRCIDSGEILECLDDVWKVIIELDKQR